MSRFWTNESTEEYSMYWSVLDINLRYDYARKQI